MGNFCTFFSIAMNLKLLYKIKSIKKDSCRESPSPFVLNDFINVRESDSF